MKRFFLAVLLVLALSVPAAQACHYGAGYNYGAFASFAAPYVPTVAVPVYAPPVLLAPQQFATPVCPQQAQQFQAPMFAPQQFASPAYGVQASFGTVGYSPGFAAGYGGAAFGVGGYGVGRSFGQVGHGVGLNRGVVGFGVGVNRGLVVRQRSFIGVQRVGVQRLGFGAGIGSRAFVGGGRVGVGRIGAGRAIVAPRTTVVRTRTVIRR